MSMSVEELNTRLLELEAENNQLREELEKRRKVEAPDATLGEVECDSRFPAQPEPSESQRGVEPIIETSRDEFVNTGLLLKSIADNSPDAIFAKDHEGRYLFFNLAAAKMLGKTVEEILGRNDMEVFGPEAAEVVLNTDRMVRESGRKVTIEEHIPIQGQIRVFHTSMFPYRNHKGELIGTMGIARDVTEFKGLESQLLRAQRMESLGTLAGGIAHNLNNILAPIVMSIDLLKAGRVDPDEIEILEAISTSAKRGAELVHKVQFITEESNGCLEEVNVSPLVKEVSRIIRETIAKRIAVELEAFDELWPVRGDAAQIHQVFLNLGLNAREAMPERGLLKFTTRNFILDEEFASTLIDVSPGNYVLVEVSDTGVGMSAEVADRIFEPFYTTKDVNEGAGLGLSTSLSIVKNHGGFIQVQSEVDGGTVVQVYFPRNGG